MLIPFDPKYRRNWMFPRNIRKIYPWKLAQICQILDQISLNEWNQDIQNEFSSLLTKGNLKSQNEIRDKKSGGARTYISQLESLGFLYKDNGKLNFTLAGKSLINFETPLLVLQTQLLNYQYPSTYSTNRNVKINPQIKIKPFVFVLKLLSDPAIQHLTISELIFPIIYGHNVNCFSFIKEKILASRANGGIVIALIEKPIEDLYTVKSSNKDDINKLYKEAYDVANTFKNYLTCSALAYEELGSKKILLSEEFKMTIDAAITNIENFIPYESGLEESFLRSYGSWNKQKDISTSDKRKKLSRGEALISAQFYEYVGSKLVVNNPEEFIQKMITFGFQRQEILDVIDPLVPKALTFFESKYLELSKGGTATARAFEIATAELFVSRLGINATHTGSIHKKGVGGYSDIMLNNIDIGECAIIDTKATSYYTLPSTDFAKMISNYIPNYKLIGNSDDKLTFITYIAGGFGGEIQAKLVTLQKDSGISVSAINAKSLIEIAQIENLESNVIWEKFKLNKVLEKSDFIQ